MKLAALNRKRNNDGSNTPLINNSDQCTEIMGSIYNQSARFSVSKTCEDEINNNGCASLINSSTTSLGNVGSLVNSNTTAHQSKQGHNVAACVLLGLIGNYNSLHKPINLRDNSVIHPDTNAISPSKENQNKSIDYKLK